MKFWRLQVNQEGRGRSGEDQPRRRSRPGVEWLEGRTLLSTIKAVPTSIPQRSKTQPAAYKPPAPASVQFPPYNIDPAVESPTDGGGSNNIFEGNLEVGGFAFPFSTVWLAEGTRPGYFTNVAQANSAGHYAFVVPVGYGSTTLQLFAESSVQDYSNINTLTVNRGNPIEAWDSIALHAIQVLGLPAPEAARDLAVLHAAQYDAVANITSPNSTYQVRINPTKGASAVAAADSAGYTTLTNLFPTQAPLFVAAEESALLGLPNDPSTAAGLDLGQRVAYQTLSNRAIDNAFVAGLTNPLTDVSAQYAKVTPFEISAGSAYRPAAPPTAGTTTYDEALSQVASLGRAFGATRTDDQAAAAIFWNEGVFSTATDPAHWNAIAEQVSVSRRDSLVADARLFAQLDFALADAGIAASDSQSTYLEPQPLFGVQAIDPTFVPLLKTPASTSYVSDNATYAAAAVKVLDSSFGAKTPFTDKSEEISGIARTFTSFAAAATEDGSSRVWGGVNYSFDVQAGATLGSQVGQAVLVGFPKAK